MEILERFGKYIKFETTSDEASESHAIFCLPVGIGAFS